jgi:carbon storage regulator
MVVLSRQCYETIMVGDDIEITVVHIGGDNVRLGITAPSEVSVRRKEPRGIFQRESLAAVVVSNRHLFLN